MAVRSRQLATPGMLVPQAVTLVYTVPADRTTIVKWVTAYNANAASQRFNLRVQAAADSAPRIVMSVAIAAANNLTRDDREQWIVLQEGDQLFVETPNVNNQVRVTISGAELFGDPA